MSRFLPQIRETIAKQFPDHRVAVSHWPGNPIEINIDSEVDDTDEEDLLDFISKYMKQNYPNEHYVIERTYDGLDHNW